MLGQVAITTEGVVALPTNWSSIGSIRIEANSNAEVRVTDVRFNAMNLNSTATNIPDVVIGYTLTDDQGDQSSSNLTLHAVTNEIQGTSAGDTITGTNANDVIAGFAGDDTLNGGAGSDIIKGGAGIDNISGGANDDQLYGGDGNDNISGGTGIDLLFGDAGNDNLQGGDGNDVIRGGAGNDTLLGDAGNDTLIGGAGNDTLTGGLGVDTFKWELADRGTRTSPASDQITDFDTRSVAAGGDILDLRDLLSSESHVGNDPGNLASYLHFEQVGADAVVHVSSSGQFAAGFSAGKEDQTITITGGAADLMSGFANDQKIIENLLNQGKLLTD
jgi:Ca2+-binding RTX toxin-like protein